MSDFRSSHFLPRATRVSVVLALGVGALFLVFGLLTAAGSVHGYRVETFEPCFDCGPLSIDKWITWCLSAALGGALVFSGTALLRGRRRAIGGFIAASSGLSMVLVMVALENLGGALAAGIALSGDMYFWTLIPASIGIISAMLVARAID